MKKAKDEPKSEYLEPMEEVVPDQPHPHPQPNSYMYKRRLKRNFRGFLTILSILGVVTAMYVFWGRGVNTVTIPNLVPSAAPAGPQAGDVIAEDKTQSFTQAETLAIAKQNYGSAAPAVPTAVTKITFHYRSLLPTGEFITVYGRAYLPESPLKNLPVFAFAPGTTGIGDECAPSLEVPAKANWANYDSHMTMYASQGYAAVTTDYEGMRDPGRIHHYMVGELEGRALLDAVRALRRLPEARDRLKSGTVFLSGYSQGGHAAFWADKIAGAYAPDVKPTGVIGYGPVMSVKQTLTDVTHAANINWFGPYVLFSYRDYYRTDYGPVVLPHWDETLATDVPGHCIDSDIPFWGHTPAGVYAPEFIEAMSSGQLATNYPVFSRDLDKNEVGATTTSSAKRINQGELDNVVLAAQQHAVVPALCASSKGPVQLVVYPHTTHYDTMLHSLNDTLGWMRALQSGAKAPTTCN